MKLSRFMFSVATLVIAGSLLTGCGHKEHKDGDGHDHSKEESGGHGGHGHGEESPSGASFKPGSGVILTDETRKILGVEVVDVFDKTLTQQVRFPVQTLGEKHALAATETDHSECTAKMAGQLSQAQAKIVQEGQSVQLVAGSGTKFTGHVLEIHQPRGLAEVDVVVGITNVGVKLKEGEFLSATLALPSEGEVTAIPKSALLRNSEGTFVYAVNGEAYFRTAVKIGAQDNGFIEITDGLLTGDQVVTKPVEALWLIELRAVKGGGHSH